LSRLLVGTGPLEAHQASLVWMKVKAVSVESLRQYLLHPPRIHLQLEDQNKIVSEADQKSRPLKPGLDLFLEPFVQDLVEIDV
jgi:hypothetical protein